MRTYVYTGSLLEVCIIACILRLAPVMSQCTRRHCSGDDNEVSVLTAMVSRLQDSMEQQQKQLTQLEETLAKQDDCTYCLITPNANRNNTLATAATVANPLLLSKDRVPQRVIQRNALYQGRHYCTLLASLRMSLCLEMVALVIKVHSYIVTQKEQPIATSFLSALTHAPTHARTLA